MILNIVAILAVGLIGYAYTRSGLFSGFLHLLCTIVAGAIAFGVWEPLAYFLLDLSPNEGFLSFIEGIAWATGLLLPFAASLAVLRLAVDSLVPGNLGNQRVVDMVGGAALGALAGYLSVGVLVIGLGFLRLDVRGLVGYNPVDERATGSLVRGGGLWIMADRVTADFYSRLSESSLYAGRSLAEHYPELELAGYAMQHSVGGGKGRNAIKPADFEVISGFRVGGDDGLPRPEALADFEGVEQRYEPLDGDPPARGSLFGYMIRFGPGAKEDIGRVVISNGQLRLVAANDAGERVTVHPVAVFGQSTPDDDTLYRFLFDAQDVFIPSIGGAADVNMGFEFFLPAGFRPTDLYVKNTRVDVSGMDYRGFETPGRRLAALSGGQLGRAGARIEDIDRSGAQRVGAGSSRNDDPVESGLSVTTRIPFPFNVQQTQGLEVNDRNEIIGGEAAWFKSDLTGPAGGNNITNELRVDRFATASDRVMVQLDVSPDQPASMLGRLVRSAERVLPPQLADTSGVVYPAVGYIYEDADRVEYRLTPGNPIRGLSQLPSISSARTDQRLTLIFLVSRGVQVDSYLVGNRAVLEFEPPVEMRPGQR